MPHPNTNHLISRVRDFCRWQEKIFGDPSAQGEPIADPCGAVHDMARGYPPVVKEEKKALYRGTQLGYLMSFLWNASQTVVRLIYSRREHVERLATDCDLRAARTPEDRHLLFHGVW